MIVGIDPGVSGAVAFISDAGGYEVIDIPATTSSTNAQRKQINSSGIYEIINRQDIKMAFMERTNAMPKNGVIASFSQGDSNGCIRTACAIAGIPLTIITPQQWKKHFKLGKDKEVVRAKAIELFPSAPLSRKKDHNRAEALLIALYGKTQIGEL